MSHRAAESGETIQKFGILGYIILNKLESADVAIIVAPVADALFD